MTSDIGMNMDRFVLVTLSAVSLVGAFVGWWLWGDNPNYVWWGGWFPHWLGWR